MLRIRLRRVGKKKMPMYRIVVADSHAPRDGAFVESLGYYHPLDNPSTIVLDEERAKHWLDKGAQPSTRVAKILKIQGVAEVSEKVATRIALGEQRKAEAKAAKKADASPAEAKTEEPAAEAKAEKPAAETKAEKPAAEAKAEEPAAEAKAEKPAAEAKAEEPAAKAPAEETSAEEPKAKASSDEAPAADTSTDDTSAEDEEQSKE